MLGYLALEMEDDATAVCALAQSVMLDADIAQTHMLLGVALRREGERERAAEAFEKALRLRPEWPDCINNLSVTLEELGRLDAALATVQRGLTVAPDDLDLRNRCGCVLCTLGRYEAGIAEYEHALALAPDFEPARLNLADAQRVRFA
jgi:tetratricopeptide (TPR) repeat protein